MSTGIRDTKTNKPLDWGEVFFTLHKHCNLTKWQIWEYTLPQIEDLLKYADKWVRFEIEVTQAPLKAVFGIKSEKGNDPASASDDEYEEIDEEGVNKLIRFLNG